MKLSHFEVFYGLNPSSALDLAPILYIRCLSVKVEDMKNYLCKVHNEARQSITNINFKYKVQVDNHNIKVIFKVRDLV